MGDVTQLDVRVLHRLGDAREDAGRRGQPRDAAARRAARLRGDHLPNRDGSRDRLAEDVGSAGLGEALVGDGRGAKAHGVAFVRLSGEDDARNRGVALRRLFEERDAAHSRHAHVGHEDIDFVRTHHPERFLRAVGEAGIPLDVGAEEHATDSIEHPLFIVHEEHLHVVPPSSGRRT